MNKYGIWKLLTVFHGMWPEHLLVDEEQKGVSKFFYFKYFSYGSL